MLLSPVVVGSEWEVIRKLVPLPFSGPKLSLVSCVKSHSRSALGEKFFIIGLLLRVRPFWGILGQNRDFSDMASEVPGCGGNGLEGCNYGI